MTRCWDNQMTVPTGTIRCMKSCQPNDGPCNRDPVHSLSHTFISMATLRDFTKPEEIVFLRTTVPAYGAYQFGTFDVMFEIQDGNADQAFDVVKRIENGVYVGVVRQVKPIIGPLNLVLKLAMINLNSQGVSHQSVINIHVSVSEFWF
ncbi:unnamed protein product [Boreogadus saida]